MIALKITKPTHRRVGASFVSLMLFVVTACATPVLGCASRPSAAAIPPFRQGVVTADQQSQEAFAAINEMLREQQIDRAVKKTSLSEDSFVVAFPASDLAVWHRAFASIDAYASKIERLLSPDRRTETEEELRTLGTQLEQRYAAGGGDEFPPGVAAGFVKLGGLLVKIKAGQDALKIMRQADPAVQDILTSMADAIGTHDENGDLEFVRGTVWNAWTQELGEIQVAFLRADAPGKRSAVESYLDTLAKRDAHDHSLASLRASLLALAAAHRQLAEGDRVSAAVLIRIVQDEHRAIRDEIAAIEAARQAKTEGAP